MTKRACELKVGDIFTYLGTSYRVLKVGGGRIEYVYSHMNKGGGTKYSFGSKCKALIEVFDNGEYSPRTKKEFLNRLKNLRDTLDDHFKFYSVVGKELKLPSQSPAGS